MARTTSQRRQNNNKQNITIGTEQWPEQHKKGNRTMTNRISQLRQNNGQNNITKKTEQ